MAYNFDVQVMGGLGPQIASGLGMVAAKGRMQREKKEAEEARINEMNELIEAVKSNDPEKVAETMIKYPDRQKDLKSARGELQKPVADAERDIYRQVITNPNAAPQIMEQGLI